MDWAKAILVLIAVGALYKLHDISGQLSIIIEKLHGLGLDTKAMRYKPDEDK